MATLIQDTTIDPLRDQYELRLTLAFKKLVEDLQKMNACKSFEEVPVEVLYGQSQFAKRAKDANITPGDLQDELSDMKKEHDTAAIRREANRDLKCNGGLGEEGVALVDGHALTVEQTLAKHIAQEHIDWCKKKYRVTCSSKIPLRLLLEGLKKRCDGRTVDFDEVCAEVGRINNAATYKAENNFRVLH